MDWGMKNRMSRLIKPETGHAVWLAVDHGYFLGPVSKLEEPGKTIKPLLPFTDALMLTRGILRNCVDTALNIPIILRVSGGNSIVGPALSDECIQTSMEEALRLNASAVAISIYIGTEHEHQTLMALGELVNEGQRCGMPVLAVTAVGKELERRDARYLSLCCRIASELGAQMVKTYYCEDFEKVVKSCPVPLVIAGGPKLKTEFDVLKLAAGAIARGAKGVDMGRNIWQSDNAIGMIKAIREVVHKGATVKEAGRLLK
ncbi:MAG: 3-hydroxy-5-phosphonooxypentane-2,4-dione thiolase [Candidatus Omnitrophota bacterium]|nr:3-hydroxy-5-phosphonooxypentane-2,4-dione thiolase [Candidatus Omnitrophota bacterium]